MGNQLFDNGGRNGFLSGSYSWLLGTWVTYVVGSFHPGLLATGLKISDFGAGVFYARGTYLTGLTATTGVANAASTLVGAVGSQGQAATAVALMLVLEASQAAPASQCDWLVGYIDTASVVPFLPNGGDAAVLWDPGASKIFKL